MKKVLFLLSVITFASCSLLPNDDEKDVKAIKEAEQNATENISQFTKQEIARAKKEIGNAVASVISKADSTLTKQFTAVEKSLNSKAEETKKELSGKISGIEDSITKAKAISFIGIAIGGLGLVLAFLAYRKRPRTNVNRVKDIITEEIKANDFIRNEIRRIVGGQSQFYRPQVSAPSQATIDRAIEAYMTSKKFRDILQQYIISTTATTKNVAGNIKVEPTVTPTAKPIYQIFARESTSMILSSIQDTYQRGKSIYKLTMSEPNATTAEITVCIELEEVKQRILKFDSQCFEPICSVIRSSNAPTEVAIKTTGTAERNGEEWKVIKPIIVEIK